MAQNRDQFAFVLAALRQRLRGGAYVQGEPLTVNDLAIAWGVSATPIREALARLAGEGLLEDRRGRGYFAWRLDVSDLEDLYRSQNALTIAALSSLERCSASRAMAPGAAPLELARPARNRGTDAVEFWEAFTARVAQEAGHRFLLHAQERLADRLAPARRVEPAVLIESLGDLNGLVEAFNDRAWRQLAVDVQDFFSRRKSAAASIVDKMRTDARLYIQSIYYL